MRKIDVKVDMRKMEAAEINKIPQLKKFGALNKQREVGVEPGTMQYAEMLDRNMCC